MSDVPEASTTDLMTTRDRLVVLGVVALFPVLMALAAVLLASNPL